MDKSFCRPPLVLPKLKAKAELLQVREPDNVVTRLQCSSFISYAHFAICNQSILCNFMFSQALPELRKYFPDAADLIPAERHRGTTRRPAATADDSDDEEKQAAKMKEELKKVKKERTILLQSLAAARGKSHGRPAGDLQSQDIAALRASLSEKQHVLNELRELNLELEQR
jgi:hypothetical protein